MTDERMTENKSLRALKEATLTALVRKLYSMQDCSAGGPLHVQLDDGNLEDEFLTLETHMQWPKQVLRLSEEILALLRSMTEGERLAWWEGARNR
jgi:hypothetical protein